LDGIALAGGGIPLPAIWKLMRPAQAGLSPAGDIE
jgi:hypothetical protein